MARAVDDELTDLLGASGREALDFHADPEIAADSPSDYEDRLRRILGDEGSSLVILRLRNKMCEISGRTPKPECADLQNCLECIIESHQGQTGQRLQTSLTHPRLSA
jgi:hypothetical protein